MRPDDDHGRPLRLGDRGVERRLDRGEVLGVVDVLDVPAVRLEALALVLGREGQRGRAVDRDVVVVVEVDELAEAEVAGDRRGLLRHTLHQVAVRADREDAVVDDLVVGAVVALGEVALRDRHADAVREPLAERPRRRLDPRRQEVLGMPRRDRAPLAEALELLHRQVVAGQVERRVLEDAGVPGREDEAVAVRPFGVGRIVPQVLGVDRVGDRRERHRRTGVAGAGLLHGVHRQAADRVDRKVPNLGVSHGLRLSLAGKGV